MSDEEKARALLAATYEYPQIRKAVLETPMEDMGQWFHHAISAIVAALQGASSGEGDAPKGVDGCEHEWVNEACDGNHYNCQRCPATFIYDRNADEPTLSPSDRDMRDGWEPIETVDRNIHRCLLWCADVDTDGNPVGCVFGRVFFYSDAIVPRGDGMHGEWNFTHYQLPPAPPSQTGKEG